MNAVCEEMKAKCELVEVAWDGIIPSLQEKKIDVIWSSMSITDKRKEVIDFTEMYYDTPAVFVAAKSSDVQITKEGLTGKIIGVQTSTTHAEFAQKTYGDVAQRSRSMTPRTTPMPTWLPAASTCCWRMRSRWMHS